VALAALLGGAEIYRVPRMATTALVVLAALSAFATVRGHGPSLRPMLPPAMFDGVERVAVDTGARGTVIRLMELMEPETRLFAAEQDWMTQRPEAWLNGLGEGDLVISTETVWNTARGRSRLLDLLGEAHELELVRGSPEGHMVIYRVSGGR
jgi:hypothetical protein